MKQFVENQMKEAMHAWDEEKNEMDFDKSALWTSMNEKSEACNLFFMV